MPEPHSRREFVSTSLAGAFLLQSRQLPAADDVKPLTFAVVTDTHLGRKNNDSSLKNWRKVVSEINETRCEFVLHLGDIVDGGREQQYPIYQATRKKLNKPIYEIPGNHDPIKLFRKYVSAGEDRVVDRGQVRFLLFNNSRRDSHDGFVSQEQIAWIEKQLKESKAGSRKVIMCCHVPVHTNRHPDRGWYVKPANGQLEYYALCRKYSDLVLASFHGHFHNGIRGWRDHGKMVESLFPAVSYNQNRGLKQELADGKATGFFVDELRPGYVIAMLGQGKLDLHYKPIGHAVSEKYRASWS